MRDRVIRMRRPMTEREYAAHARTIFCLYFGFAAGLVVAGLLVSG